MKLIVGIGNPDTEYQHTRHNVGWMFLDWLEKKFPGSSFQFSEKIHAEIAEGEIEKTTVILMKPHTYVNKSGDAVKKAAEHWKLKPENVIIVQDDLDIPFGKCKVSFERNSGGHRGIDSIVRTLKTNAFYRIRIGLGTPALDRARAQSDEKRDAFVRNFVLKPFTPSEREKLQDLFNTCDLRLHQILKSS